MVWSEECIPVYYSDAFDSFVQEVEVLVREDEVGDGGSWTVWED